MSAASTAISALALALDAQPALRPDLRLVAMSATLDGARFATLLGDAPVIESEGRAYPLDHRHLGRDAEARIEHANGGGDPPGAGRAARAACSPSCPASPRSSAPPSASASCQPDIVLHRLHGSSTRRAARRDRPAPPGPAQAGSRHLDRGDQPDARRRAHRRRFSGLARRPRYDRGAGLTRLVTERASQAAITQRAGRAARQAPGVAIGCGRKPRPRACRASTRPKSSKPICRALLLDCAIWGVAIRARLPWLDPPPAAAIAEARKRLIGLGAIDDDGQADAHGRAIAALPLPPRLAHMLIEAGRAGWGETAAEVAVLLRSAGLAGPMPTSRCGSGGGGATRASARRRRGAWRGAGANSLARPGAQAWSAWRRLRSPRLRRGTS